VSTPLDTWTENPKPFVWQNSAEQILERLAGYCVAINQGANAGHHQLHNPST
jgi:hypothetical protein